MPSERLSLLRARIADLSDALSSGASPSEVTRLVGAVWDVPASPPPLRPQIPEGGEPYREELESILSRFNAPHAVIDCGPGWFGLLADLDRRLKRIFPAYRVVEVKEKFATLRFYWLDGRLPCCELWHATHLRPASSDPSFPGYQAAWEEHLASAAHAALTASREPRLEEAFRVVAEIQRRSATVCEMTGGPGVLMRSPTGWFRTLSPLAAPAGYEVELPADPQDSFPEPVALPPGVETAVAELHRQAQVLAAALNLLRRQLGDRPLDPF